MPTKYSVDSDNRLIVACNGENLSVNGTFSIDEENRLIYWLNEPQAWRVKYQLPEKIVFTGNWKLDVNYDLELRLIRSNSRGTVSVDYDTLTLKGELISCESDKLVFEIKSIDKNGLSELRLLKLSGIWQANESNQIYFSLAKKESPDILNFKAGWQLNQNQQIIYTYQKSGLKTKNKILSTLTFLGFWQISSATQLTYILSSAANSKFDFKAQLQTPNLYPKEGVIKYRLGAGVKGTVPKVICLYGVWKLSRKLGLVFDMEYAKGEVHSLSFGAEVNFNKKNAVIFNLKNEFGEDLGLSVMFARRFLEKLDADFFLRLKHSQKESGVDAGVRIPF